MSENPIPERTVTRPVLPVAAIVTALACAAVIWPWHRGAPVATFRFGPDRVTVAPFDEVPAFDAMTLELDLPRGGYVYVVSFDYRRGTVCYYPTDFLGTDHLQGDGRMNAFGPGRQELPGPWDQKPQSWFVPDAEGAVSLCVLVSPRVLEDLERALVLTRQVGNRAFRTRAMGHYMPRAGRDKVIGRKKLPHPFLAAAQTQEDALYAGPMVPLAGHPDIYVKTLNVRPGPPRPGVGPPGNPFQKQLHEMAEKKLQEDRPPK